MNSAIKVSVIVPIYNVEKYLDECLKSLERQTFKEFEVIMVDDGSTDGSALIAEEYCKKNSNFKLITRKNGGLSAARNTGLDHAMGKYVYFLDSDDYLADDAIGIMFETAENYGLDQVRFEAYSFDDGTNEYLCDEYKYKGKYEGVMSGTELFLEATRNGDYFPSCCLIFINRDILENEKIRFVEGILHEDNLFNFELTCLCKCVSVLNLPLYYRRNREGSITQLTDWLKKNHSFCISAEKTDAFLDSHSYIPDEIRIKQISYYVSMMLDNWFKMSGAEQKSKESRACFDRMKPLIDKYLNGGNYDIRLFYTSPSLYRCYKSLRRVVARMIGRC